MNYDLPLPTTALRAGEVKEKINMSNHLQAFFRVINGQIAPDDPIALAVFTAVGKHNCRASFDANAERVTYFMGRVAERGIDPNTIVIVLLNVDDANGAFLAEALMPGYDWQEIRERGEVPFARGIVMREYILEEFGHFDKEAAEKLQSWTIGIAVVVVDHGTAEIFTVEGL